jgi:hypothetical protein
MSDGIPSTLVAADEGLARFVLYRRRFRSSDQAVRQDAFVPYPHRDISVTRHQRPVLLSESELWAVGQAVAIARPATLYGRADLVVADVMRQRLEVESQPLPDNLNHAGIIGWPADKSMQKIIAQELAAAARFVPNPAATPS